MEIKSKKDIEVLEKRIIDELGIDLKRYQNEEVAQKFLEIIDFQNYVIKWTIRPLLISLIIFIVGFFILDLGVLGYLFYGIVGLILFFLSGFIAGLLFLIKKIKWDVQDIIDYSFEIMETALNDLGKIDKEKTKNVLDLLFKGVIHIIAFPTVAKIISEEVPIIDKIINNIIYKILTSISNKVKFNNDNLSEETDKKVSSSKSTDRYLSSISFAKSGLEKIITLIFSIVKFPFKIWLGIILTILVVFLFLIN
tara:strand:+ start:6098 stop:6853 length:756 start_codon:yes stop_codon:yes gene_type:complete